MKSPSYRRHRDILEWHGILIFCGYLLARVSKWTTPTGLWSWLGRRRWLWRFTAGDGDKLKPWWQDVAVILILFITGLLAAAAVFRTPSALVALLAYWLLADSVCYHAGVLWFDDLQPGKSWDQLRVLSHRRVLFHGMFNFFESILLFGVLYERGGCATRPPPAAYSASFTIATTLSAPDTLSGCGGLVISQVVVSLFFLVVVIGLTASAVYRRRELSPTDDG